MTNGNTIYYNEILKLMTSKSTQHSPINQSTEESIDPIIINDTTSTEHFEEENDSITNIHFFDPLINPPPIVEPVDIPWDTSLVILIPLLLGINNVKSEYIEVSLFPFNKLLIFEPFMEYFMYLMSNISQNIHLFDMSYSLCENSKMLVFLNCLTFSFSHIFIKLFTHNFH